jgi:hypothetical protein
MIDLTDGVFDIIVTSSRRYTAVRRRHAMGPRIREELGRLRLDDLLREADERSKDDVRRRSTRRPSPRTGGEA